MSFTPMHIMHIISAPAPGGAEIYVKDLAIEMKNQGHRVTILFLAEAEEKHQKFADFFLGELHAENIHTEYIGRAARRNPIFGLSRTKKIIDELKPDIVHSHLYYGVFYTYLSRNCKKIYTHHNVKIHYLHLVKWVLRGSTDQLIGISEICKNALEETMNMPVDLVRNGVSKKRIHGLTANPELSPPTIIAVGSLNPRKNYDLLLNALALLDDIDFKVRIVGDGPERARLEALSKGLKLSDKLTFVGNINNVVEELAKAQLFAMSSAWEGLPIALIEASMVGLPVLVTDVGGCPELVKVLQNGKVVPSGNTERFAKALRHLLEHADERQGYAKNGLERCSEFELASALEKHLQIYTRLLC